MDLADEEYGDWEDSDTYGPFDSVQHAKDFLGRHFSNPGATDSDDGGRRPPPTKSPNGRPIVSPNAVGRWASERVADRYLQAGVTVSPLSATPKIVNLKNTQPFNGPFSSKLESLYGRGESSGMSDKTMVGIAGLPGKYELWFDVENNWIIDDLPVVEGLQDVGVIILEFKVSGLDDKSVYTSFDSVKATWGTNLDIPDLVKSLGLESDPGFGALEKIEAKKTLMFLATPANGNKAIAVGQALVAQIQSKWEAVMDRVEKMRPVYSAVVSVNGYAVHVETANSPEGAKALLAHVEAKTRFTVVRGTQMWNKSLGTVE